MVPTGRPTQPSPGPAVLSEVAEVVVAERGLLGKGFVVGSAGSRFCGLRVRPEDLVKAVEARVLDLSIR